jgi:hypothetical protein
MATLEQLAEQAAKRTDARTKTFSKKVEKLVKKKVATKTIRKPVARKLKSGWRGFSAGGKFFDGLAGVDTSRARRASQSGRNRVRKADEKAARKALWEK